MKRNLSGKANPNWNTATDIDNRDKDLIISEHEDRIAALKGEVVRLKAELNAAHAAIYQALQNL